MQAVTKLLRFSGLQYGFLFCSFLLCSCGGGNGNGGTNAVTPAPSSLNLVVNAPRIDIQNESIHLAPYAISFNTFGSTTSASSIEPAIPGMTAERIGFRNIKYSWNFGEQTDAGTTAKWGYGPKAGTAFKNTAYGPVVTHVYEASGTRSDGKNEADVLNTYTVNVTAFDGVNPKTIQKQIVVAGQNYYFNNVLPNSTVCLIDSSTNPTTGTAGCPDGAAVQILTSWSTLGALAQTYKRILLKRGSSWKIDDTANISVPGPGLIGAFGTSNANPQIIMAVNKAAFNFSSQAQDWRLVDLEITTDGTYGGSKKAVVSNGALVRNSFTGAQTGAATNLLALRLNLHDLFFGFDVSNQDGLYIVDSVVNGTFPQFSDSGTNYNGIGGYVENVDNFAIMGCLITNIPGNHGFRVQGSRYSTISYSEFSNTNGISLTVRGNTDVSLAKTVNGVFSVPWDHVWTEQVVVSDNTIGQSSGGSYAFYSGPQSVNHAERVRDMVFERNFVTNDQLEPVDFHVASGVVVRNNIMVTRYNFILGIDMTENTAGSPAMDSMYVYNNDFYKIDTSRNKAFSATVPYNAGNVGSGLLIINNIAYGAGNVMDGSTNGSQASFIGVTAGNLGRNPSDGNYYISSNSTDTQVNSVNPWVGTMVGGVLTWQYFQLLLNSYPVSAGSAIPVWDDFGLGSVPVNGHPIGAFVGQ